MPRQTAPCKDCKDRCVGCHSICQKYIEFQRINEKQRQLIQDAKGYVIPKGSYTGDIGLLRRRPGQ